MPNQSSVFISKTIITLKNGTKKSWGTLSFSIKRKNGSFSILPMETELLLSKEERMLFEKTISSRIGNVLSEFCTNQPESSLWKNQIGFK